MGLILLSIPIDAIRVGVVVEFPNGTVFKKCLILPEGTNGYEIMQRTGLKLEWAYWEGLGHALCKIEDTGCPASSCWCEYPKYWNFYIKKIYRDSWRYSPVGFDTPGGCDMHYCAEDMDMLGFAYGGFGTKPEELSFDDVCPTRRKREPREFTITIFPEKIYENDRIEIRILDKKTLEGISGAEIEVFSGRPGSSSPIFSGKTDDNGTVVLEINRKGMYRGRVSVRDYSPSQEYFDIFVNEKSISTSTSSTSTTTTSTVLTTSTTSSTTISTSTIASITTSLLQTTTLEGEPNITGYAVKFPVEGGIIVLFIFFLLFLYLIKR